MLKHRDSQSACSVFDQEQEKVRTAVRSTYAGDMYRHNESELLRATGIRFQDGEQVAFAHGTSEQIAQARASTQLFDTPDL